jgi:hypothetical protein
MPGVTTTARHPARSATRDAAQHLDVLVHRNDRVVYEEGSAWRAFQTVPTVTRYASELSVLRRVRAALDTGLTLAWHSGLHVLARMPS